MKLQLLYKLIIAGGALAMFSTMALSEPLDVKSGLWEMTVHTKGGTVADTK